MQALARMPAMPPPGYSSNGDDCNDGDPSAHPGSFEICDAIDNDCDGDVDESGAIGASTWYADADADGYGDPSNTTDACVQPTQYVDNSDDCNDDPSAGGADQHPGRAETWYDGVDQNCDGNDSDQDGDSVVLSDDCDDTDASSTTVATDADCDGSLTGVDCNDGDDQIHPNQAEVCGDGVDNDCDGSDAACACSVNPSGTTLIATSEFCDPNPPSGWTQCAGWTNTSGDDVSNTVLDGCLNSSNRLRIRVWDSAGVLEEDVFSTDADVSQWQSWNYLGGNVTRQTSTYWTGDTTFFTTTGGGSACYFNGTALDAPNGTLTVGTGNSNSVILAPGHSNEYEYRVNCQGSALAGRNIALYK